MLGNLVSLSTRGQAITVLFKDAANQATHGVHFTGPGILREMLEADDRVLESQFLVELKLKMAAAMFPEGYTAESDAALLARTVSAGSKITVSHAD